MFFELGVWMGSVLLGIYIITFIILKGGLYMYICNLLNNSWII
jgi:hypothetical protein